MANKHPLRKLTLTQKTTSTTPPLLARLKMGAQVLFYFGRFNSLVLVVESLRSIVLPLEVTSRLVDCSWKRKLTLTQKTSSTTPPLFARLKMGAQVLFYSGRFNSLVLVVEGLRSNGPLSATKATMRRICAASVRASDPPRSPACSSRNM